MSSIPIHEVKSLSLKALECIESGDPEAAAEFAQSAGFKPDVFSHRLAVEGETALAMEVARWRRTGFDPMVDITGRKPASWVLREKATGLVIMETFEERLVHALNTAKYYAVPIHDYLAQFNGSVRDGADWVNQSRQTQCNELAKPQQVSVAPKSDSPAPGF